MLAELLQIVLQVYEKYLIYFPVSIFDYLFEMPNINYLLFFTSILAQVNFSGPKTYLTKFW